MRIRFLLTAALLSCGLLPARADVAPASPFTDHAVLQRDIQIPIWGTAAPGETVAVAFGGQRLTGRAGADGKWKLTLAPMPADAAPRELTLSGATNTVVLKDVLVGEVWLCSGQSNMGLELRKAINATGEVAAANYPAIRAFTAFYASATNNGYVILPTIEQKRYALSPQDRCMGTWKVCTPQNAKDFSGVAYFFARELHRRLDVPVGILVSSMGATAIEAWTSLPGLEAVPAYRERAEAFDELARAYLENPAGLTNALAAQKKRYDAKCQTWFAKLDREDPGLNAKWMAPELDTADWKPVTLPVTVADNPLGAPVASIWFRKEVEIPAAWAGQPLELRLGVVDSVDESYVNGVRVGRTWFDASNYWEISRVYPVPPAAAGATRVSVALRLLKLVYPMGLFGPAEQMKLVPAGSKDQAGVSLAGEWRMKKAQDLDAGLQPQLSPSGSTEPGRHYGQPGVMYNGLIHPLIPYAIRGAIWYQGEANAPFYVDYRSLLPGLIESWRKEWGQGDFPFGVVQLADYWGQQKHPVERGGYTPLREAQAVALRLTNTFLATAVGVGEGNDIHPKNKQEVGRRLALGALGTTYGFKDLCYSGPLYKSMSIEGSAIRVRFDFAKGLHAHGEPPVGFAIAGEDRKFYFAEAKIEGDTVVVRSAKVPKPVAVRYAWATNPVCNLYNAEELPVFQFRTDNWDMSQLVITDDPIVIPSGWVPK